MRMTFASMFPDNVGCLVIDGVVSPQDYYTGEWTKTLLDLDKVLHKFYSSCAQAGPAECAIAEPTAAGVKARVDAVYQSLKTNPIGVDIGNGTLDYGVIDYGVLRGLFLVFTYRPFTSGFTAPELAAAVAGLEQGNGTLLWARHASLQNILECECDGPTEQTGLGFEGEADVAISCTDTAPVHDTVKQLEAWYEQLAKVSSYADMLPTRVVCAGWKIQAAHRFTGQVGGNTSFPLLFIGNTADPVAPLINAKTLSGSFPGSAVLTQDGPGHTSFAGTSQCTFQAVRTYFQNGTLPAPGIVCPIEETMFGNTTAVPSSKDDLALTSAVRQLVRNTKVKMFGSLL